MASHVRKARAGTQSTRNCEEKRNVLDPSGLERPPSREQP
jgi:hypothetical protein